MARSVGIEPTSYELQYLALIRLVFSVPLFDDTNCFKCCMEQPLNSQQPPDVWTCQTDDPSNSFHNIL